MPDNLVLNKKLIESIYKTISEYHEKYLKQFGVKLPKLYASKGKFTKDALVLVYLTYNYPKTRKVSKEELTKFVRSYYRISHWSRCRPRFKKCRGKGDTSFTG